MRTALLSMAMLGAIVAVPAQAQFSEGYKFLEAVKKKEGEKVESALSTPGATIINTRDVTTGETALHIVTNRRDLTWLQFLLAKGANVNGRDGQGRSALQLATNLGWRDGVAMLLEARANTEVANDAGETPLIAAVHRHDVEMTKLLLRAGANPDRADNSGRSARDYAALEGGNDPVLAAIKTDTKPGASRSSKPTYGPSL
ncbi:ankyrin repeat domain-containing protein [uncultured Novosphingobium sp.]|uniref:ankyrin repeat domain-containing protein n=1 Tax=uncultured Novosphingobium sp. TaxID=292277 RepID=UPI00258AE384|nr:ankyrin repeat domain-containing protein [uncultured Novosphingobium sp.]